MSHNTTIKRRKIMGARVSTSTVSTATKMAAQANLQNFIKDSIKKDKVVVFSKSYCPYCKLAKEVFEKVKQKITVIELDERQDGAELQNCLATITGFRTVPQVFINGNCVGGGSDVQKLYENGGLQPLLAG